MEIVVPLSTLAVDSVRFEKVKHNLKDWTYRQAADFLDSSRIYVNGDDASVVVTECLATYYCALILGAENIKVYI